MSNLTASTTESYRAGAYTLDKVHLFTNLNNPEQYIDLTNVCQSFIIKESIYSMGITLEFFVYDSRGLLEAFKIMGNEKINVILSRRDVVSKEKKEYDLNLRIGKIDNYSRQKETMQAFKLTCVSDYVYHNNLIALTKPFSDSVGKSITDICKNNLNINKDNLEIAKDTGSVTGVYPRLKPLSAIKWLLKNITDNKTPFFFYERISDNKLVLESYKAMIDKDVYDEYTYEPYFDVPPIEKDLYELERKRISTMSSDLDVSQLESIADGWYGSTLHTLDIATKSYKTVEYNYNRDVKLNDNDALSDNMKLLDTPIKEFTKGKNFFISQNSLAYGANLNNYNNIISSGYLDSHSYLKNLNTLTINITINGDFDLKLGNKIHVSINRAGSDAKEIAVDKYFTGNYIITAIEHSFKERYKMNLTLKKDSFEDSIDDIIQIQDRAREV